MVSPHLHSGLRQSQSLAQLLSHERVRVVRLVEEPLQFIELLQGKVSATPPLLQFALRVLVLGLHVVLLLFALIYPCWERCGGSEKEGQLSGFYHKTHTHTGLH